MSDTGVHNLASTEEFDTALKEAGDALVVLDCFATWCGPCKAISPKLVQMAKDFSTARFYKIDVDELQQLAQNLEIRAMPTFILFKKGEKVNTVVGANEQALRAAIQEQL